MPGHLNALLWDIEDFIRDLKSEGEGPGGSNGVSAARHYLLVILTFIDKWVLETAGYPDYFMEARKRQKTDPRDYIAILGSGRGNSFHRAYTGVEDYFYDVRKRMDRFLAEVRPADFSGKTAGEGLRLIDCIIEAQNLTVHYLSCLLNRENKNEVQIPPYRHSNTEFER